jgi:2-polyprenyl-3-methyl-5-hydroxy-6-metoxy-1,4-benzoquinol methylase
MQGLDLNLAIPRDEIEGALKALQPDIPWTHYFQFGELETIRQDINPQFYKKSVGLGRLGELAVRLAGFHTRSGSLKGLRVLDVASAEGGHSLLFAQQGAREVIGIEGRPLYVERSRFAARAFGVGNARFEQGDVRAIDAQTYGAFDLVFCSGILHHLGQDDFWPMIQNLHRLCADTLILYTHVSSPLALKTFRLRPTSPVNGKYEGHLFQEHAENATAEERERQVRASLDNTYSFWATPESLLGALKDVGFSMVCLVDHPHVFGRHEDRSFRPVIVARR